MKHRVPVMVSLIVVALGVVVTGDATSYPSVEAVEGHDALVGAPSPPEDVAIDINSRNTETAPVQPPDGLAPAGAVVDASGTIFLAVSDPTGADAGVYRITEDSIFRLPGTENMLLPGGIALDESGHLYATDSANGAIWRIPTDGSTQPELWLSHPSVADCSGYPLGAAGIAFWQKDLIVINTMRGLLARIPITNDGTPGTPETVAGDIDCSPTDKLYGFNVLRRDVSGNQ